MRVLVLGGTRFVGRHLAAAALARGHRVTLLNRGVSAPGLFPEAEHLRGDRSAGEVGAPAGRRFDAALDTSGYYPAEVEATSRALRGWVDHYTFAAAARGPAAEGRARLLPGRGTGAAEGMEASGLKRWLDRRGGAERAQSAGTAGCAAAQSGARVSLVVWRPASCNA